MDAYSPETLTGLVDVPWRVWVLRRVSLLENDEAVVAEIFKVSAEKFEELFFSVLEEVLVLLNKLGDNVIEQGKSVGQVHHVIVDLAASGDNMLKSGF